MLRRFTLLILIVYGVLTVATLAIMVLELPYHTSYTTSLTVFAFVFAIFHSGQQLGWRRAFLLLGLTFGVSLLFESVGVATGLVYGPYHYTDRLGPKFLGLVPYLIPLAWFMMSYPSYIMAERITPSYKNVWLWRMAVSALAALIMTAWDLAMDPVMVAGDHWIWEIEGPYFGIPLQNFAGWWVTTFVTFGLFTILARRSPAEKYLQVDFERLAVWSYAITTASTVLAGFQGGLDGPALVGIFAMLPWILTAWWKTSRSKT
jgi:uncharacterized membrane protein